ncbi:hypothetical protein HY486_00090 [Candidatus Woesearchaeota archaeon]|nr:hypothetical protein [Candidatus Woesearchaeota archaeon]
MEAQKVRVRAILEILGAPKEHVERSLKEYVVAIRKVHSIEKEVHHPAEQKENMFSAFCELEIVFKDPLELLDFCFESMPSSVEIIEPEFLRMSTSDMTDFLNDLQARLHFADMTVKNLKAQSTILNKNATNIFNNFIVRLVEQKSCSIRELSDAIGVSENELLPFAEQLVESGRINKKEGKYCIHA